ncbi:HAD hydrolase family protein [Actinomadura decatromicini]|uniref:HAD hydrolase family protein n=1 Tax=Actinomadura decatromicini TaxID=2604572 RepID=A0A5D3FLJ2_9ACTN|nr:HAD hydrolase family protein [Actinomadura decatromicini]TYK49171.1 HAD hydrolase family protein [Actinomadura decatromicini]
MTRAADWIVTDLDGTLVERDGTIVEPSRAALRRFMDAGGTVVIATGRGEESALPYYRALDPGTPAILYNGARVVDLGTGDVLHRRTLGAAAWTKLADGFGDLPGGVWPVPFSGGRAHARPADVAAAPALRDYARRDGLGLRPVASWDELPPADVIKVMLICDGPELMDAAERAVTRTVSGVTLVRSEANYLEVLPEGSSKGAALRELAAARGVPLERVAAIGDNPNDLDMIRAAGLGAAVGDAAEAVRAAADVVVGTCADGGVADLVARVLP